MRPSIGRIIRPKVCQMPLLRAPLAFVSIVSIVALSALLASPVYAATADPVPVTGDDTQKSSAPTAPTEATPTPTNEDTTPSPTNLSAENAQTPSAETGVEVITVTGSRIRRPDFSTPNPVISVGSDQIEESGTTNLTEFLTGYPTLQGSSGSAQNSGTKANIGATGLNLLNLRNLGSDRTLVLMDGRRHVAGIPGSQAVDINTIPSDLVG